ncbi:MAG: DUF4270 family protein [Flavobacteriales bacterium]|nr:DUF4270 family protein [Flavobacteriales bacterium]
MIAPFPRRFTALFGRPMLALLVVAVLHACRKPEDDLGLELLPGEPLGLVADTAAMHAFTFEDSAVQTSGLSRVLVGSYLDPEFGALKASLVAQLRLTTNNIGQGQDNSGLVADSIVLSLAFEPTATHYGNLSPQRFVVQELSTALSIDSVYHSNDRPEVLTEDLVALHGGEVTPDPTHNVILANDTVVPQVRIPLRLDLAERFLDAFGTSSMVDNPAFLGFFKGIKVSVENGAQAPHQGGILYFNTTGNASKVTVYYHDQNNQPELLRSLDLIMSASGVRYTSVERDPTQAEAPGLAQALSDPEAPAQALYLQTLGGYRAALRFPGLDQRAEPGKALSKAELIVPVNGTFYPYYLPSSTLLLFREVNGNDVFLPDQVNGATGIGGNYDVAQRVYRFNITRYASQVMNGTLPNEGLLLVASSSGVSANRTVLCGPEHPDTPMRLLLTFTTY